MAPLTLLLIALCLSAFSTNPSEHQKIVKLVVSPHGNDSNPGTNLSPLLTLDAARLLARRRKAEGQVVVVVRGGTYRLLQPIEFRAEDSGVKYMAAPGENVVISGGTTVKTHWTPLQKGVFQTTVPNGFETDQLFVNGVWQPLARYPNFDAKAKYFDGVASDCLSPDRVKRWKNPTGGFIHALHASEWGDVHYRILGKESEGKLLYEGGWQNNRKMGMKPDAVFVEGIFEELDSPGEWFLDRVTHTLYYYPPHGLDLQNAHVEGVSLSSLFELHGTEASPVRNIEFTGFTFRSTRRTFMENREPLLRSDWTIYRGGTLFASGSEDCSLNNCFFDTVGGNAIFVNEFNRRFSVRDCRIENAGANGVAFVGSPKAVRNPLFEYNERLSLSDLDLTPGPRTNDYPSDCLVDNCLITRTGRIEKQSAPVEISMSRRITVRHCSIYDVPRAGINIGDGCWGGHVIEGCDVFDTVKETGDHGSFNSWGRDRYWGLKGVDLDRLDQDGLSNLPLLDCVEPITLKNNRWRCDHGWDIDLDDGSSNYHIVGNLCLHGGLKLREGFHRMCENNIIVDNSFHMHVWFKDCHDVIRKNIVFTPYQVIQVPPPWGDECDFNLQHKPRMLGIAPAESLMSESGRDSGSRLADAQFIDPGSGDYRVKPQSPALALGFQNFAMNRFGVTTTSLRKFAKSPLLPGNAVNGTSPTRDTVTVMWMGAEIKNLSGLGERSAVGLGSETGVLVNKVSPGSQADKYGLRPLDVILALGSTEVASRSDLEAAFAKLKTGERSVLRVWRSQNEVKLSFVVD